MGLTISGLKMSTFSAPGSIIPPVQIPWAIKSERSSKVGPVDLILPSLLVLAGVFFGMEIGIDSFVAAFTDKTKQISPSERMQNLLEDIQVADKVDLDIFGIGEHHRKEFLDSAPPIILSAAAA